MNVSAGGIEFIKQREGLELKAYKRSNDVYTIGYGLTYIPRLGRKVRAGDTVTKAQAETDLKDFINTQITPFLNQIFVNTPLKQSSFDAIVSYCFNRSVALFKQTLLCKLILNNPSDPTIKKQFELDWGTNVTYKDSLIKRRVLESVLYFKDISTTSDTSESDNDIFSSNKKVYWWISYLIITLGLLYWAYSSKLHIKILTFLKRW